MNPEHLQCPVCKEIFDGHVYILKCGHNLCHTCRPKLTFRAGDEEDGVSDSDEDSIQLGYWGCNPTGDATIKCPLCTTMTRIPQNGLTRNMTIESITEDYREKNGLLASLDKERKEKLIKKGNQINKELQDKLSFIKVAEKVISKQDEIIELQSYISKIVHDFEEVSKNSTPNELRNEMDKLEKEFLEKMENEIFTLSLTESAEHNTCNKSKCCSGVTLIRPSWW
jgi:hypothetical protein